MAVPGHSGCYAVVPGPVPTRVDENSPLIPLARREMQVLSAAVDAGPRLRRTLMHMLNRREAVDSSQIEGTHTQFDGLSYTSSRPGRPDASPDPDAEETLNYLRAYTLGVTQVRAKGRHALDTNLVRKLHSHLMKGDKRATPGAVSYCAEFYRRLRMEDARFIPPPPSEVPRLMADLDRLVRYESDPESHFDIDVLCVLPSCTHNSKRFTPS